MYWRTNTFNDAPCHLIGILEIIIIAIFIYSVSLFIYVSHSRKREIVTETLSSRIERSISAILFGILSVVTLAGNTLVFIMFIKRRDWLNKTHPCLLLALAVQDIITGLSLIVFPGFALPADVYDLMPLSPKSREWYCTLIWSWYIPFTLSLVSIYTCLMLAADRCLAVWKPLTYRRLYTSKALIVAMVILPWLGSFSFEIETAIKVEISLNGQGTYVCKPVMPRQFAETMTVALLLFVA